MMRIMLKKAYETIKDRIKEAFPNLQVLLNFPEPHQKIVFPYLSIQIVRSEQVHFGQEFIDSYDDPQGNKVVVHDVGEWRVRLNLHYYDKSQDKIATFIDDFNSFFKTGVQDALAGRSITLPINPDKWYEVLNFTLLGYELDQEGFQLQKGSGRRVIFSCKASIPDLIYEKVPIMTDVKLDERSDVGENVDASKV